MAAWTFTECKAGVLVVTCLHCEEIYRAPDKGIGRANIAAWKTRHQHAEQGDA